MPKRVIPIDRERERAIGARVREARERLRYGQAEFAKALGLSADKLYFIETGRTPLSYAVAWSLRESYRVSLDWLSGDGLLGGKDALPWPHPNTPETPAAAYFSEVEDRLLADLRSELGKVTAKDLEEVDAEITARAAAMQAALWGGKPDVPLGQAGFPAHIVRRDWVREILLHDLDTEIASLTPESVEGFADALRTALRQLAAKFPHLPREVADENAKDLAAVRMRSEATAVPASPPATPVKAPVKPPLPARRRRAPRA